MVQCPGHFPSCIRLCGRRGRATAWVGLLAVWCWCGGPQGVPGAELDLDALPPPADVEVIYERDVLPILEAHCFKCHATERPKGEFTLTSREAALTSGTYGGNLVPGRSAESPLIHFVAGLVENSRMPPEGEGEALTTNEVAMLRAWIDQGVSYGQVQAPSIREYEFSQAVGYFFVDGDDGRFQAHRGVHDGLLAGVDRFVWQDEDHAGDDRFRLEGRVLRDDYELEGTWTREKVGFVRVGFDQFRRYYDDSGGYSEVLTPSIYELDRDLYLDTGKAWVEAGWERPGWPRFVLGYDYYYKEGEKSTTQWLPVQDAGSGAVRNVFPATKRVYEDRHVLRLDVTHHVAGFDLEDNFNYEFYDLETSRQGVLPNPGDISGIMVNTAERYDYRRLANTVTAQKQVYDWLLVSGGYLYSRLFSGEAGYRQTSVDAAGNPVPGYYWSGDEITLDQQAHAANLNVQATAGSHWTVSAGVMPEWTRQEGMGDVQLNEGLPPFAAAQMRPASIRSDHDRFGIQEHVGVRFTGIPFTVLFAEGRLEQESLSQFESKAGQPGNFDTVSDYARDTDASALRQDYRAGFHVSPWARVSLSGHYRRRMSSQDFDHERDEQPLGVTPAEGYSAFLRALESDTDEVELKWAFRPARWLKTTLSYRLARTEYETETDAFPPFVPGGVLENAGVYDQNGYGLGMTLTPWSRFYISSTFNFSRDRIRAFDNGSAAVVPYEGETISLIQSGTYFWNDKTDLTVSYSFSHANYDQNNHAGGLPKGVRYDQHAMLAGLRRVWSEHLVSNLQYGFFLYDEPSSGGANDYAAHAFLASLSIRFP